MNPVKPTVSRHCLDSIVNAVCTKKLVLLSAAAGYGKSVLIDQIREVLLDRGIKWVDSSCFEPEQFKFHFISQIRKKSLLVRETQGKVSAEDVFSCMLEIQDPLVLVIDNYERADSVENSLFINTILERLPHNIHILMACRYKPSFEYAQYLLSDEAILLDNESLGFNRQELSEVMKAKGGLEVEAIDNIHSQTTGWPIAVNLCLNLLSNGSCIDDFSGKDTDLGRYIEEQIFTNVRSCLKTFLLNLAIFEDFHPDLCDHVFDQSESTLKIIELYENNFLLISLDRNRKWFRVNPLFKDFLLEKFELSRPEHSDLFFNRAMHWSVAKSRYSDAISYAIRSGERKLLSTSSTSLAKEIVRDNGLLPNINLWWQHSVKDINDINTLPISSHFWLVWSLAFSCQKEESEQALQVLKQRVNDIDPEPKEYASKIRSLEIALNIFNDNSETTFLEAKQWLEYSHENEDPFDRSVVCGAWFLSARLQLNIIEAKQAISFAKSTIPKANSSYGSLWISTLSFLAEMDFADTRIAHKSLQEEFVALGEGPLKDSPIHSTMALFLAKTSYEQGHYQESSDFLQQGFVHIMDHGLIESAAAGIEVSARLLARKSFEDAMCFLNNAEFISSHYPSRLLFYVRKIRTQLQLQQGDEDSAKIEISLADINENGKNLQFSNSLDDSPLLSLEKQILAITLLFIDQHFQQAQSEVERILQLEAATQRPYQYAELLIIHAAIALKLGDIQLAGKKTLLAVNTAVKFGLYRVFIDNRYFFSDCLSQLLQTRYIQGKSEEQLLLQRLAQDFKIVAGEHENGELIKIDISSRESELLVLLESDLTVQKIADHLFLSKATVKWHLVNLYRKLDVNNRSGAISSAKAKNLI